MSRFYSQLMKRAIQPPAYHSTVRDRRKETEAFLSIGEKGPGQSAAPVPAQYRIEPVKDDKQRLPKNPGWEFVGKHPFRTIVSGDSSSGKTTLVLNLMNKFYSKYFDELWLWSPNFHIDSSWRALKWTPTHVFTKFNEADVEKLHQQQLQAIQSKGVLGAKKVLVVMDDMLNEKDAMQSQSVEIFNTIGRHLNVSTLVIVQKLNKLSLTSRTNASNLFLFHSSNLKESKAIVDEQCSQLLIPEFFYKLYNEATTRHKHGFLSINHQAEPREVYRFDLTEIQPITKTREEQRLEMSVAHCWYNERRKQQGEKRSAEGEAGGSEQKKVIKPNETS